MKSIASPLIHYCIIIEIIIERNRYSELLKRQFTDEEHMKQLNAVVNACERLNDYHAEQDFINEFPVRKRMSAVDAIHEARREFKTYTSYALKGYDGR